MNCAFLLVFSFLTCAISSCSSMSVEKNKINRQSLMNKENDSTGFSEVRRLNHKIQLPEYSFLTTFDQTLTLYSQLEDKRYSRSEPIPALFDNEFFLVLKPKLKKQYGDIEITKLQKNDAVLDVYYKEIINSEYLTNKQNNPILILRVNGKVPSKVNLIHQNEY